MAKRLELHDGFSNSQDESLKLIRPLTAKCEDI